MEFSGCDRTTPIGESNPGLATGNTATSGTITCPQAFSDNQAIVVGWGVASGIVPTGITPTSFSYLGGAQSGGTGIPQARVGSQGGINPTVTAAGTYSATLGLNLSAASVGVIMQLQSVITTTVAITHKADSYLVSPPAVVTRTITHNTDSSLTRGILAATPPVVLIQETGTASDGNTVTGTWPIATTPGDALVAFLFWRGGADATPTPPSPAWAQILSIINGTSVGGAAYVYLNAASQLTTGTWNLTSGATKCNLHLIEYSGVDAIYGIGATNCAGLTNPILATGYITITMSPVNTEVIVCAWGVGWGTTIAGITPPPFVAVGGTLISSVGATGNQLSSQAANDPSVTAIGTYSANATITLAAPSVGIIIELLNARGPTKVRQHSTDTTTYHVYLQSHTTDTLRNATYTQFHKTDAWLLLTVTKIHSTSTLIQGTFTRAHSTDSDLKETKLLNHKTDVWMGPSPRVHSTDVFITDRPGVKTPGFVGIFGIWLGGVGLHTLVENIIHLTDSTLIKWHYISHSTDSRLMGLFATYTITHTTDADLRGAMTRTHKTDADLLGTVSRNHKTDANLRGTIVRAHATDANLRATFAQNHRTDADLLGSPRVRHKTDCTTYSWTAGVFTYTVLHETESDLLGSGTCTHSTDCRVAQTYKVTHHTDTTYLSPVFHTYTRAHVTDADIAGSVSRTHKTDAWLFGVATQTHTTDTRLKGTVKRTHTTDMLHGKTFIKSHTTDTNRRGTRTKTHTTDARYLYIRTIIHQTDSRLLATRIKAHTTDTSKFGAFTRTHTADAYVEPLPQVWHTTDTDLRGTRHLPNYVDSFLQGTYTVRHATDSLICNVVVLSHNTDTIANIVRTIAHSTDTWLPAPQTVTHDTDSIFLNVLPISHTTDTDISQSTAITHTTDTTTLKVPLFGRWATQRVGTRIPAGIAIKARQAGNDTPYPIGFLLTSSDRIDPILGATPVVSLLKPGVGWALASGVVSEVADGWYELQATAADLSVPGEYVLMATAAGAEPAWVKFNVVAPDPYSGIGLSPTERNAIADLTLTRAFTSVAGIVMRCVLQAARALWDFKTAKALPMAILAEDSTVAWQANVTTDPTIKPIRGMTPDPPSTRGIDPAAPEG
jgi:hypothetical protein